MSRLDWSPKAFGAARLRGAATITSLYAGGGAGNGFVNRSESIGWCRQSIGNGRNHPYSRVHQRRGVPFVHPTAQSCKADYRETADAMPYLCAAVCFPITG